MGDPMRAADVARVAGVSVQQVRNYAEMGILPPVERTPSGYRSFTTAHTEAVLVARELAAAYGWPTARTVMRAVHRGELESALAALDAGHAELDRGRAELATAREALEAILAAPDASWAPSRECLRIGQVADVVGVRPPVLRLWEAEGLLRPDREPGTGYRRYPDSEVRMAFLVALLRRNGHRLAAARVVLDGLRARGSAARLRAELDNRGRELHRRSLARLGASAALHRYLQRLAAAGSGGAAGE
ncbi:MerR family transcriptional regulator [Streptomyces sp. NPDC018031]|uniref:MerR family transcriptional regulator n=1 Tax=Streptomyces sp. NPDC018031 TaxID=3365033 RepID=UPI00378F2EC1